MPMQPKSKTMSDLPPTGCCDVPPAQTPKNRPWSFATRIDKVWRALLAILLAVAVLDQAQFVPAVTFTARALLSTAPFILFGCWRWPISRRRG